MEKVVNEELVHLIEGEVVRVVGVPLHVVSDSAVQTIKILLNRKYILIFNFYQNWRSLSSICAHLGDNVVHVEVEDVVEEMHELVFLELRQELGAQESWLNLLL